MILNDRSMFQGEKGFDRNEGSNEISSVCLHSGRIPALFNLSFPWLNIGAKHILSLFSPAFLHN